MTEPTGSTLTHLDGSLSGARSDPDRLARPGAVDVDALLAALTVSA